MNILISDSTDIYGGGEDYVLTLALLLRERGHHLCVSTLPDHLLSSKCSAAGIETAPLSYIGMGKVFSVALQLRKILVDRAINIVHSNANYDRTCAGIAAVSLPAAHIATVHSAHSIQHNVTHWARNKFAIDHFIAVAPPVQEILVHHDRIPPEKVTFIPNGVPDNTDNSEKMRRDVRAELEIPDDTVVIGNVARLVPFKGHAYLLRTVDMVLQNDPNTLFLVLGDGELRGELETTARKINIEKHIRFLGFRTQVRRYYHAFDIYCHSSIELAEEAFPLAILDALATKIPVASTKVGGIGMMVRNGITGFLTTPEQPEALANALRELIRSKEKRQSMGSEGYKLFREHYHASIMADKVEDIYAKVTRG